MISNSNQPPEYTDKFLNECSKALKRRGKAIRHHGRLTFSHDPAESFEWLTLSYSSHNYPSVIVQLVEGGKVSLYVRSNRRIDRGKVLLELRDLRILGNAETLVEAFEWTIDKMQAWHAKDVETVTEVKAKWDQLSVRILPP